MIHDDVIAEAILLAADEVRNAWGVTTKLHRVLSWDDDHADDDIAFLPMQGRGSTHVMHGRWDMKPEIGNNRWTMAKVAHANLTKSALRFAAKAMHESARDELVRSAIKRAGLPEDATPAWAFVVHPLARAIVEHLGGDKEAIVKASNWIIGPDLDIFSDKGIGRMHATRYGWRIEMKTPVTADNSMNRYEDASNRAVLTLWKKLPSAVIGSIRKGTQLETIVDHPAFRGLGVTINSVSETPRSTIFNLAAGETTLADPPEGIEVNWVNMVV